MWDAQQVSSFCQERQNPTHGGPPFLASLVATRHIMNECCSLHHTRPPIVNANIDGDSVVKHYNHWSTILCYYPPSYNIIWVTPFRSTGSTGTLGWYRYLVILKVAQLIITPSKVSFHHLDPLTLWTVRCLTMPTAFHPTTHPQRQHWKLEAWCTNNLFNWNLPALWRRFARTISTLWGQNVTVRRYRRLEVALWKINRCRSLRMI